MCVDNSIKVGGNEKKKIETEIEKKLLYVREICCRGGKKGIKYTYQKFKMGWKKAWQKNTPRWMKNHNERKRWK